MREPAEAQEGDAKQRPSLRLVRRRPVNRAEVSAPDEQAASARRPSATSKAADIQALLRREWRITISVVAFVLGIVFILLGWYGAAYTNIVSEQIPYLISGGLLGLALIIVAAIMASAAVRDREAALLRRDIARAIANAGAGVQSLGARDLDTTSMRTDAVYAVPGGRSFHLAGCPIIEGKDGVRELRANDARRHGLEPCKLCTD